LEDVESTRDEERRAGFDLDWRECAAAAGRMTVAAFAEAWLCTHS
jgi:hypothetical protein